MPTNPLTALELARISPAGFARYASEGEWKLAKHLVYLNKQLMRLATREIKRLIVSMPPRHGKSELISKYLPAWITGALRQKVIFTAYSSEFAREWGVYARDLIKDYGEEVFQTKIRDSFDHADHWETTNGGVMYTVGAGGSITGRGCDWLIIDDPIKNVAEANSPTERANTINWFRTTTRTRLEPNAVIIIVMTRWHDEDLVGTLLKDNPDRWTELKLPAIAEEDDPIGREVGDPLWPERWSLEALMELQEDLEPHEWSSLFQQNPVLLGGNHIQVEWWRNFDTLPPATQTIIAWDCASSIKTTSAYSCAAVWSRVGQDFYLRDVRRARVEFPTLVEWAHELNAAYPGAVNVIEDASSGTPLIQVLRSETQYPIYPQTVHRDKMARLNGVMHLIAGGRCFIPTSAPWRKAWMDEHHRFPSTTYKDQVDTTSLALGHFIQGSNAQSTIARHEREAPWYTEDGSYRDILNVFDLEV